VLAWLSQNSARPFTLNDLILANSLKTGVDAALMGFFLWRKIGGLHGYGIVQLALKVGAASLLMGGAVWLAMNALTARFRLDTLGGDLIVAIGAVVIGAAIYLMCALALRVPEMAALPALFRRRVLKQL
jgi:hypothetical protein